MRIKKEEAYQRKSHREVPRNHTDNTGANLQPPGAPMITSLLAYLRKMNTDIYSEGRNDKKKKETFRKIRMF